MDQARSSAQAVTGAPPPRLPRGDGEAAGGRPGYFVLVGAVGFAIDAGLTAGLARAGLDPFTARAAAIPVAVLATWQLNRRLTFAAPTHAGAALAGEGLRYGLVAAATSVFNWSVYSAALLAAPALPPFAALVIGSGAAMAASYAGMRGLVFRG